MKFENELTIPSPEDSLSPITEGTLPKQSRFFGIFKPNGFIIESFLDEQKIRLGFKTEEDLQRFCRFVNIFVNEVAPGNSYGGYFPAWDSEPHPALFSPGSPVLDSCRLEAMTRSILHKRLLLPSHESVASDYLDATPKCFHDGKWLRFHFDEARLPARVTTLNFGDLARVVDDSTYRRVDAYFIDRFEDNVILFAPGRSDDIMASLVVVPACHTMQIRNYYKDSAFWWKEYGAKLEATLQEARDLVSARINGQGRLLPGELP